MTSKDLVVARRNGVRLCARRNLVRDPEATRQFQSSYIRKHIESAGGNMSDAAVRMGRHRSNLYRKMRQLGMTDSEAEDPEPKM